VKMARDESGKIGRLAEPTTKMEKDKMYEVTFGDEQFSHERYGAELEFCVPAAQFQNFREVFAMMDIDHGGTIELDELMLALDQIGLKLPKKVAQKLVEEADGDVDEDQLHFIPLDTSNCASVRKFVELLQKSGLKTHTLILNAGVMLRSRGVSVDGYEMTMATNHFGHHLLVQSLLPSLLEAESRGEQPRIVLVGSNMCYMHGQFDFGELGEVSRDEAAKKAYLDKPYELFRAYGQSKLANLHFTTELARRLRKQGSKIPVNEVHPGEVLTEVMRDMHPVVLRLYEVFKPLAHGFLKSASQGSFCTLHVATDPSLATSDGVSGAHFIRLSPAPLSKAGSDQGAAKKLWAISDRVTGEASMA